MTEKEKDELIDLKARCLNKDGSPRKNAKTENLRRLQELCEKRETEDKTIESRVELVIKKPLQSLTPDEKAELQRLEKRANQGRSILQPLPIEMRRLAELRKRANV